MQLKQLLENDDAVSPVIGVILMVAITVILAAVIATFVLGLGEQVSSTAPQASFSFEYSPDSDPADASDTSDGFLSVTHDGGDSVKTNELFIRGQNGSNAETPHNWNSDWDTFVTNPSSTSCECTTNPDANIDGSASGEIGSQTAVVSGDFLEFPVGSDGELSIVYTAQQGDTSATLGTWEGPDA